MRRLPIPMFARPRNGNVRQLAMGRGGVALLLLAAALFAGCSSGGSGDAAGTAAAGGGASGDASSGGSGDLGASRGDTATGESAAVGFPTGPAVTVPAGYTPPEEHVDSTGAYLPVNGKPTLVYVDAIW